jgi:hypothetical protein
MFELYLYPQLLTAGWMKVVLLPLRNLISLAFSLHLIGSFFAYFYQLEKVATVVLQQGLRSIKFRQLAIFQYEYFVALQNSIQTMSDCQDGAVGKMLCDHLLDQIVSLDVNTGRGFAQDQDFCIS